MAADEHASQGLTEDVEADPVERQHFKDVSVVFASIGRVPIPRLRETAQTAWEYRTITHRAASGSVEG